MNLSESGSEGFGPSVVELMIKAPLSNKMKSGKPGTFMLRIEIQKNETPGNLISRLAVNDPFGWDEIIDKETGKIKNTVRMVLNGRLIRHSELCDCMLTGGDRLMLFYVYTGG